ncbi:MAG: hypothetical protein KAI96_05995, partial [Thermodesulfovibrionia bacterium]|nr:hypothetical protein [Thermodesulfovibrionia bacterium]
YGDYKKAFVLFGKAETLYKKIGDRVSYAYTIWGIATAYKMIGDLKQAGKKFKEADVLFKKTGDPRGKIYCMLGRGELNYLNKKENIARKSFLKAKQLADYYGFKIEKRYAEKLLKGFRHPESFPLNLP